MQLKLRDHDVGEKNSLGADKEVRPHCFRCLLSESDATLYKTVREYVESLSPENRVEERIYRERLEQCRACRHLINGLCGLCGCFVEARAAKKDGYCPDSSPHW